MKFSERMGITEAKVVQIDSMDERLRTSLWNVFFEFFGHSTAKAISSYNNQITFYRYLYSDFFRFPSDEIVHGQVLNAIKTFFYKGNWYSVCDFVEFIAEKEHSLVEYDVVKVSLFVDACNKVFEREAFGYRFLERSIRPIINEMELQEIGDAINNSLENKLSGVNAHLKSALDKFSDRKSPDYRNSIKESISAVESICKIIVGDEKATLGEVLKELEKHIEVHSALKAGFDKIYGYASDEEGIRHAMLNDNKVEAEDAKYMLVSCSAFVNYLIEKARKAGKL